MACCSAVQEFAGGCVEYIHPESHLQINGLIPSVSALQCARCSSKALQAPLPQLPTNVDISMSANHQRCQRSTFDVNNVRCDGNTLGGRHPKSAEVLGTCPVGDRPVVPACVPIGGEDEGKTSKETGMTLKSLSTNGQHYVKRIWKA